MGSVASSVTGTCSAGTKVAHAAKAVRGTAACVFPLFLTGLAVLATVLLAASIELWVHRSWISLTVSVAAILFCISLMYLNWNIWTAAAFTLPLLELAGLPQEELEVMLERYEGWAEAHTPAPRPHYRHRPTSCRQAPRSPRITNGEPTSGTTQQGVEDGVRQAQATAQAAVTDGVQSVGSAMKQASDRVEDGVRHAQGAVADGVQSVEDAMQQASDRVEDGVRHAQATVADEVQQVAHAYDDGVQQVHDAAQRDLETGVERVEFYINLMETAVCKAVDVLLSQLDQALLLYPLLFTIVVIGLAIAAGLVEAVPGILKLLLVALAVVVSGMFVLISIVICCCVRPLLSSTVKGMLEYYVAELKEVMEKGERSLEGRVNNLTDQARQPLRACE